MATQTTISPADALTHLSKYHRIAVRQVETSRPPLSVCYEVIADELHGAMMAIARGADPQQVIDDQADDWVKLGDDCDPETRHLLQAWAQSIRTT